MSTSTIKAPKKVATKKMVATKKKATKKKSAAKVANSIMTITKVANSIMTITTYKNDGVWVFDDARVGLVKEPFVAGADTLLDILAGDATRVTLVFSDAAFPGATVVLDRVSGPNGKKGGTDYVCRDPKHEVWLCPALNLYYDRSPKTLYVQHKPL